MITELRSKELIVQIKNAGAELVSIKNCEGLEFLWQAKPDIWPRHAPVLFPIVGKLRDNVYKFKDSTFNLSQHGFARDMDFVVSEKSIHHCTLTLKSSAETLKKYPFEFNFNITYSLSGSTLKCIYSVLNTGKADLIFGVGAHPGFNCPLMPHERFEDYFLEFEKSHYELTSLKDGLREISTTSLQLQQNRLPLTPTLFDNDALVFENRQINKLTLRSQKSSHKVEIVSEGWPYYGIWSKKGCREFVCLEPWYGITDKSSASGQLDEKDGMITLHPEKSFNCEFSISLS